MGTVPFLTELTESCANRRCVRYPQNCLRRCQVMLRLLAPASRFRSRRNKSGTNRAQNKHIEHNAFHAAMGGAFNQNEQATYRFGCANLASMRSLIGCAFHCDFAPNARNSAATSREQREPPGAVRPTMDIRRTRNALGYRMMRLRDATNNAGSA